MAEDSKAQSLRRRFYKAATVVGAKAPFAVHLDDKPLHTPLKAALELPERGLAEAVAAEWQAQDRAIDPFTMPLTRLANTAIDRVGANPSRFVEAIVKFAESDLVCYRASEPQRLSERQAAAWDPVLAWAKREFGARFETTAGIVFRNQPSESLQAARSALAGRSSFELAAIHNMTTLTGSALLALMVAAQSLSGEEAWAVAHVDEDWQVEHWGVDAEAKARRGARRREFDAAATFLALLRI